MARIARIVVPGLPHHVTQRGNRRMQTFFCDEDYREYLALLVQWCGRDEAELAAAMRQREDTGRPLGDESFVKHLSALLGRDLLPKKRGPKGKRKANN